MFEFKQFKVDDSNSALKVGTDGVLLGAWADVGSARRVADIGAGCGLIALMIAQRFAGAHIDAVEIDADSCGDASRNFASSPWPRRLNAVCRDALTISGRYDAIVSNPPFFNENLRSPSERRASARHEGSLSPASLIRLASRLLSVDGTLSFIAPSARDSEIDFLLASERLYPRRRLHVVTAPGKSAVRTLHEASRIDGPLENATIILRNADGFPSVDFKNLTSEFYLNF